MTAYRIISAEKASGVAVSLMCELLNVSRSGYYEWGDPRTERPRACRRVADGEDP